MPNQPRSFDERELRERARSLIASGTLPVIISTQLSAGYGADERCAVCALAIGTEMVAYELADPRNGQPLHFHTRCHQVWQLECQAQPPGRAASQDPGRSDDARTTELRAGTC